MTSDEQRKLFPLVWTWRVTNERQKQCWGKGSQKPRKEPPPTWPWPVPGEKRNPSSLPWCAGHLWDSQRHLHGTLDRRRMCVLGYENTCHVKRGRRTWLPFLKKKKKPFALPFSLGLRGQIKTRAPAKPGRPTPSQSGSQLPLRLAFPCLATKGRTKNKTAQSRL